MTQEQYPKTEPVITYTFREVLERLEAKLDRLSEQLDKDLEGLEIRVEALEAFRAKFLPMAMLVGTLSVAVILVELLGHFVPGLR